MKTNLIKQECPNQIWQFRMWFIIPLLSKILQNRNTLFLNLMAWVFSLILFKSATGIRNFQTKNMSNLIQITFWGAPIIIEEFQTLWSKALILVFINLNILCSWKVCWIKTTIKIFKFSCRAKLQNEYLKNLYQRNHFFLC